MLPFSNALELFFEMLLIERNASPHTLEGYRRDLLKLQQSLPKASVNVEDVTADQCQHFFELLHESGLSPLSRARCHSSLMQFFKFLMVEQYTASNPMMMVARPRKSRHLPHALTLEEIDRLNHAAQSLVFPKNLQAVAILEILYASGMRISELLNLSRQEVLREGGVIVQGKGHRERVVPLHDGAYDAAWAYLQTLPDVEEKKKAYLFPSPRSPYRALTRQRCGQILKELSVLAHIEPGRVYPHALRHAFATHLLEGGADLLSVQKLLGHSSVNTTEIYTHLTQSHLTEALVSKHPLQKEARKKEER